MLIENVTFLNGHGASIGSIPDCSGCHGIVTNITYRNLRFLGESSASFPSFDARFQNSWSPGC